MMLAAFQRLAGWGRRPLLVAALAACAMGASAAPALGASEWRIKTTHHNPYGAQCKEPKTEECFDPLTETKGDTGETFARESADNVYKITVKNESSTKTTNGKVTVTDTLPKGIVLFGVQSPLGEISPVVVPPESAWSGSWNGHVGGEGECAIVNGTGGGKLECSTSKPLKPGESYAPIELRVFVGAQTAPPATSEAVVENKATVEGGNLVGTASPFQEEAETKVTPAVPFGIDSWSTRSLESLGNPFSQAGGHPFAFSTEFVLNYTTTPGREDFLTGAHGAPKELEVELPPGFVGNLQNTPRCPLGLFILEAQKGGALGEGCRPNTAVGFTATSLTGRVVGGHPEIFPEPFPVLDRSLVYNLQPTPGHLVALGFFASGSVPFMIEGSVRSDGSYGVTVGDNASPSNPVSPLAISLTTCENGASGVSPGFHCNEAPASSRPFLTNPTECSGPAPVSTLRANPWNVEPNEPADNVSKTVATNLVGGALSEKSFMTGCESLQFHPELEFKPSPPSEGGSTQADEPTGMTLGLKVPQSNEAAVNATPELRNLTMTLPAGMTVSPSAADGLQACSKAQFWPPAGEPADEHREPAVRAECPEASKLGTAEVFTPLLSGAPTIEGVPTIEGGQKQGEPLTCSEGMWSVQHPALSYRWLRNDQEIAGATEREYRVVEADKGKALQCQVTATNGGGSSVAVSSPAFVKPEPPETPPPFPPSSIAAPSGTPSVGSTLTCSQGNWTRGDVKQEQLEKEVLSFSYQWLRGGKEIAGATAPTYTLASADQGNAIQCQVTGKNEVENKVTKRIEGGTAIADSAAVVVSPVPSPPPPLPGAAVQGQLFQGQPECSPCTNEDAEDGKMLPLLLEARAPLGANDPQAGVIIKLHGAGYANTTTGQLTTKFEDQPQLPFELLQLKLKGGPRAPLANPQSCGPATTSAELTPWSAPFTGPPATPTSTYSVDFDGAGGACPETLPFNPSFSAGTTGPTATTAGAYTNFSLTFSRQDREQNLAGLQVTEPLGLVGKIAGVPQCGEAQANEGTCGPESQIGTTTAGAGPGPHPLFLGGKVYLTGPYKGAPFGLSIVVPAVAGPFNLGNEVVRSAIYIDPHTAAVTVVSDPLKQIRDGVPFRLREVNVEINRPGFLLNPTNCSPQQVSATVSSAQGASAQVSSPFGVGGCGSLPFHPELTAEADGNATKANGTTFIVKVKSSPGQANIAKTYLQLPIALPSRLTTIQKACVDAVFEANPASCPEGSNIGIGIAHTPLLAKPLEGPAYLVSHGGAAFPDVEFVLQGEGVLLILDGKTDIKGGITYSRFETVPDAPVETFETVLPAGPHSALTANVPEKEHFSLCNTKLEMPTEIIGQNGAVIKKTTQIAVKNCAKKPSVKIAKIRRTRNGLLVTATTNAAGTVWVSGAGLRTTHKKLTAGTHTIRVAFTKWGSFMQKHHKKTSVRVKLIDGRQAVAKASSVRL